jgi:tetratricopeptide (TPR) repeat protein
MNFALKLLLAAASCALLLAGRPAAAQSAEWRSLLQEANSLFFQGKFEAGLVPAKKALELAESEHGPRHPTVAASLNRLAELYRVLGQFAAAEPLYKRSLAIRERARGPDSPEVAQSLNNLAELYSMQRQYAAAEPLFKRALAIRERVDSGPHPDTGRPLNGLAEL